METRNIPIDQLHPNEGQIKGVPKNPRLITEAKFEKLKKSIIEDPEMLQLRPLGVYETTPGYFVILLGNMRFRAMKDLGYTEAPCKIIPTGTPAKKLRAYTIKDNVSFGDNEWDIMANEWDAAELSDWGVDIPGEWATVDDVDTSDHEAKEDDFDEENETIVCRCKKGDIWQCGNHRVMCGDSTCEDDVKMLMGGGMADMMFTDPPYNVNIEQKKKKILHCNEYNAVANDNLPMDEFKSFLGKVFENANNTLKDTASYYVFTCQGGDNEMMMMMMMREKGIRCRHQIIWVKDTPVFSMGRLDYDYKHEPILYGWKKSHHFYRKGEQDKSVWEYKRTENKIHPTMKPVELIANALHNSSKDGDSILDLFGGSGSTLIACEQLNRKCYMMELDPHYCDVILARWEKLTGREAVKIN